MARFDKGVKWYTSGIAHVSVHFPEDAVCCKYCSFCRAESELGRYWCRLLNSMVYAPNSGVLENCPIVLGENKESE